jgi:hypothetical protein
MVKRIRAREPVTAAQLKELLDYNPLTGVFYWRVAPNGRVPVGSIAGTLAKSGHIKIMIGKRGYLAHRLAWLWMTEEWPSRQIDHRDTKPANNIWINLRLADYFGNRRKYRNNTTGFKGVSRLPSGNFQASIAANGKRSYLGAFPTPEAAHAAYSAAAKNRCGEFARAI